MKYPNVTVKLVGNDGNAFFILGSVIKNLRRAKVSDEEISAYEKEAMSGDYNNLLDVTMKWVNVE